MAAYLQPGTPAKEAEQEEFTSTSPPSPMDYAERTKALNAGQPLEPLVQRAAKKCTYCQTELKGPCAAQFADLYKCAVTKGDKLITSSKCTSFADIYLSCVEEDYPKRQSLCPMYMTFLKKNIERSPCKKQIKMMQKMCRRLNITARPGNAQLNSICTNATRELRQCVAMTKGNYDYMDFWMKYDGQNSPI